MTIVFPCTGMIFIYRMLWNVFGMGSKLWHPMNDSALEVRTAFPSKLTHYSLTLSWVWQVSYFNPNEWNLTDWHRGSSNHHIFDSNHPPPGLQVSTLTTHPLNSWLPIHWLPVNIWGKIQVMSCICIGHQGSWSYMSCWKYLRSDR